MARSAAASGGDALSREAAALGALPGDTPDAAFDQVRSSFEELGLNGHQARILLALLRLGSASATQLAQLAGVHRTSAYPVLQELRARGLAQQVAGPGALWTTSGRDAVLDRLRALQQDRLRVLETRIESARTLLADIIPDAPADGAVPYVHIIASASQARAVYDRLLAEARQEFLVLNRPPYSAAVERGRAERAAIEEAGRDEVNPAVLEALDRGVTIRVLYERAPWEDAAAEPFRRAMAAYHRAGVKGRIVDELPMKLAIADRASTLFALADPVLREVGFPMNLLIEHSGYSSFQADAFERQWASARAIGPASRGQR